MIEGVDVLPNHVVKLSETYPVRSIFLGCAGMTPERFDAFPGHSHGYASLPEETRHRFAMDIPGWSEFLRQEAKRYNCHYIDTGDPFPERLSEAESLLQSSSLEPN